LFSRHRGDGTENDGKDASDYAVHGGFPMLRLVTKRRWSPKNMISEVDRRC